MDWFVCFYLPINENLGFWVWFHLQDIIRLSYNKSQKFKWMARRTVGGKGFLLLFKGQQNWGGIEEKIHMTWTLGSRHRLLVKEMCREKVMGVNIWHRLQTPEVCLDLTLPFSGIYEILHCQSQPIAFSPQ